MRGYYPFMFGVAGAAGAFIIFQLSGTEAAVMLLGFLAGGGIGAAKMTGEAHDHLVGELDKDGLFDRLNDREKKM